MLTSAAIQYGLQLAASLPQLLAAGADMVTAWKQGAAKMQQLADEKRDPTPAEWDALNASIDAKLAELNDAANAPDA
jgi:hypothetical protein